MAVKAAKWTDNDEKILLFLALEHGYNNYNAIAAAWFPQANFRVPQAGQGGHSLRGIADRLRSIRAGVQRVGVCQYFSASGRDRVKKSSTPQSHKQRRSDRKASMSSKKTRDYDGVPFLDDHATTAVVASSSQEGMTPTVVNPSPPDRKLRDRTTRASFSYLLAEDEGVEDDDDGEYEDKDDEAEDERR